jgi:hypothetical protein
MSVSRRRKKLSSLSQSRRVAVTSSKKSLRCTDRAAAVMMHQQKTSEHIPTANYWYRTYIIKMNES